MDTHVRELGEFKKNKRKPWVLLVLFVLAVGAFGLVKYMEKQARESGPVPEPRSAPPADASGTSTRPAKPPAKEPPPPIVYPEPDPGSVIDVSARLMEAKKLEQQNDVTAARQEYLGILKQSIASRVRQEVEQRVAAINVLLVTTPRRMPEKEDYIVQSGDSVQKIAKKLGTTIDLIQKSNELRNPNYIRIGYRLRVLRGAFSIRVSKQRNDLLLLLNGEFFKRYSVGTGKFGRTPTGTFAINDRIKEPVWWHPDGKEIPYTGDPKGENILGTRWLALKGRSDDLPGGYGIHGTWDNASIGKAESAGCVRMRNEDVEELYMLVPLGTSVVIED